MFGKKDRITCTIHADEEADVRWWDAYVIYTMKTMKYISELWCFQFRQITTYYYIRYHVCQDGRPRTVVSPEKLQRTTSRHECRWNCWTDMPQCLVSATRSISYLGPAHLKCPGNHRRHKNKTRQQSPCYDFHRNGEDNIRCMVGANLRTCIQCSS